MKELNHECGVLAGYKKNNSNINLFRKSVYFLSFLQHRGQDSCGVSFFKDDKIKTLKFMGLIKENLFKLDEDTNYLISHTRYSMDKNNDILNAQPFCHDNCSLCFNGEIKNIQKYRDILVDNGYVIKTKGQAEIIVKWLFYRLKKEASEFTLNDINKVLSNDFKDSAFSMLVLLKDRILAFKDNNAICPLVFVETKDAYYISSEDYSIKDEIIKKIELKPSQGIEINDNGYFFTKENNIKTSKHCVFEVIYFAHQNSCVFNSNVKNLRIKMGEILAENDKDIKADIVIPVMNSGFCGAYGYSKKKNIKLSCSIRNRENILRTYIEKRENRSKAISEKYYVDTEKVRNKDIILVDDSIVRGATMFRLVSLLKQAGVKKIHIRLTSPKIINTCSYGVDIPRNNELLAYKLQKIDNITMEEAFGVESVRFIPLEQFQNVFHKNIWCENCFLQKTF